MKQVGFIKDLHELVLSGTKNITWRLWDDKKLQKGYKIYLSRYGDA
jgi:hypothetical protein